MRNLVGLIEPLIIVILGILFLFVVCGCGGPDKPRPCSEACKADLPTYTIRRVCRCNMDGEVLQ